MVGFVECEQEGDGVGSAGDGDGEAVAGLDLGSVEGERGGCGHAAFILSGDVFVEFEWREWIERQSRCEEGVECFDSRYNTSNFDAQCAVCKRKNDVFLD